MKVNIKKYTIPGSQKSHAPSIPFSPLPSPPNRLHTRPQTTADADAHPHRHPHPCSAANRNASPFTYPDFPLPIGRRSQSPQCAKADLVNRQPNAGRAGESNRRPAGRACPATAFHLQRPRSPQPAGFLRRRTHHRLHPRPANPALHRHYQR